MNNNILLDKGIILRHLISQMVCGKADKGVQHLWCQRRTVKNLKRRPENDPNAGNIAPVIYAGTLSAGQLSAGSSAGGTGWTPAFHRSLSR